MDGDGAVEQFLFDQKRRANDRRRGQSTARLRDLTQRSISGVEQRILMEEVLIRIAGEPSSGKTASAASVLSARAAKVMVRSAFPMGSPSRT